jgi:DNA-binding NarL/FixJ family response regulator
MPIRVLLADDHRLLRAGLISLLRDVKDVDVVAEAGDGEEALALVAELKPDVLLTDIAMPKLNGLEVAARVTEEYPATRVIILSMHLDEEYVRAAVSSGAAGYLLKDTDLAELDRAIRAVVRGETFLSPAVSTQLMADYQRLALGGRGSSEDPLTPRQREVLRHIAEGKTTKAIARLLGISTKTVETHRTQLMERLNIHDVAGLVRYAIRSGLVDPGR